MMKQKISRHFYKLVRMSTKEGTGNSMLNLMKLENRIVLDGAGFSDALDHSADSDNDITHETSSLPDQDEGSENSDTSHISDAAMLLADSNTDEKGTDVVLISNQAPDYQTLADSVDPDAQVIIYDAAEESVEDVIARVTEVSESTGKPINSVTILSHGGQGFFFFGNEIVSASNFQNNSDVWNALDEAMSDSGKIYLFGCNVADGSGQSLLDSLSEATGVDVYASDDASGAGGDWELEAKSKNAEDGIAPPVSAESLAAYDHDLLLSHSVTGTSVDEDRPGLVGIYLWGDVSQNSHSAGDFQLTAPLSYPINNYKVYYEGFTTDRPIVIEGKVISDYHKWTIDYQPDHHESGTVNFGYTLNGISGTSTLTIDPINDPPEVDDDTFYIKEDAVNGTFVTVNQQGGQTGQVNAYETPATDEHDTPFTYTIIGGDGQGIFEIDNAGRVKLRQGPLDYETKAEYKLQVEVRDSGGDLHEDDNWNTGEITIRIEDVPEGPVVGIIPDQHTNEDQPVSGTLSPYVTDPDTPIQNLTFQLESNASIGNVVLNSNGTFTYTPNPSYNHDDLNGAYDTFRFRVSDGTESAIGTVRVDVTPVNDEPSFNINDADKILHVNEDGEGNQNGRTYQINAWTNNFDEGPSVKPPYNEENQSYIDFQVTTTVNEVSGNTTLFEQMPDIVIANTAENNETGTLKFKLAENAYGKATVRVTLQDNGGTANGGDDTSQELVFTIIVDPVNDPPKVEPSSGSACYVENDAARTVDSGIKITDIDSETLYGATVKITDNYQPGQDVLTLNNTANGKISSNFDNGTLTLTGGATIQEYQTALQSITYKNVDPTDSDKLNDNPTQGIRQVTFAVTDTQNGIPDLNSENAGTRPVFVDAINDGPELESEGTVDFKSDTKEVIVNDGLTIDDVDDDFMSGAQIKITVGHESGEDVLKFTETANIKIQSWNAQTGTLVLTGVASKAEYQAALQSVTYANSADQPSGKTRTIQFTITDNNSDGQGNGESPCNTSVIGPLSASGTRTVNLFEAPDPDLHPNIDPSVGVGDLCYGENDPEKIMADQFILKDEDSGVMADAMMQITNNYVNGEDVLSFENTANITGAWDAASGTMTLTGDATVAEYQAAIRTIKYLNQGGETPTESVRTVTLTVTDTDGLEGTDTMTVTVDAVNDAPTLTTGQTSNLEYTDGDGKVVVDDTLTLADVDDTHMTSATVAIGDYVAGEETLHFENTANITGEFKDGVLTLTGIATKAEYQAAIRSVQYENTGDLNQQRVTKTITFNVYDNNSKGTGSRDCSFVDPSDPNYDPDRDPGGIQPGTIIKTMDVGESNPNQPVEPPPPRPDGVYPDSNNPTAKPFDDNLGTDQTFPGSGSDTGGMMEGTRSLGGPEEAGDAPLWNGCSLEEALREHLGCRFAPGIDPLSRFSAVKWGDLGWAPPRLEEEFDLYSRLFLRQAGDPGFGIELGDLAHNLGGQGSFESLFAGSGNESFNGMGPGELLKATGWDNRSSAS
ncbi:DUF4347 domain-containing protein [Desulfobacterales bacterium HSG16]|nr:DUF4347 domain-containing protein [Desulfobacterales bacterium HSG16]